MSGWEASIEGKYLPWLGVVADLDWHYGSRTLTPACTGTGCTKVSPYQISASRHELMFGPRASVSMGRCTPSAHLLLGFTHQNDSGSGTSNANTSFATAIGGGLDYKLAKTVSARAQLDVSHATLFHGSQNNVRLTTGLVFRF